MNGRSSKAAGVTKFKLERVESDTNGRILNARYGVDGLRTKKQDAAGNSSREYGAGINTSASTPLTQNSTAPSISYISGPMILGAEINGEFVYHLGDALSTVRDVVDDEGDVIRSFEFDEYGNMLNSSGSGAASPKTWIGGLSVNDDRADSGLWNMGHRNYAGGVLGRFISRDPIGHRGNLNLYAYPTNPVTLVDPEGLDPSGGVWTEQEIEYYRKIGEQALERAAYQEWLSRQPHTCPDFRKGEHLDPGYGVDVTGAFLNFFLGNKLLGVAGAGFRARAGASASGIAGQTISQYPNPNRVLSGFGDLGVGEVAKIQRAVNQTNSPLTVIGSAAKGTRGQLSDIDYVVIQGTEGLFSRCNLPGPAQIIPTNTPLTTWPSPSIIFRPGQAPIVR